MKLEFLSRYFTIEKAAALVTVIGFPLLLVSLYYAYEQDGLVITTVGKLEKIARSQNNILLSQMFFGSPVNLGIIEAIESKEPILKSKGGKFSSTEMDKYLGDLETVWDVYEEKLLSEQDLCGSFSPYAQEAEANSEVQDYLKENSDFFDGVRALFTEVDRLGGKIESCKPSK
jgi:hypothetical protein